MCLGNKVGFKFNEIETEELFKPLYGSMILELGKDKSLKDLLEGIDYSVVGTTADKMTIEIENNLIELDELAKSWEEPLDEVFPIDKEYADKNSLKQYSGKNIIKKQLLITKPKVIIPIFTGTHGEYDMANCFKNAGAKVETFVFKSLTKTDIEESFRELSKRIRNSQILGLPNGQIYGDEPEAGGKLLKIILDNPYVKESIEELLYLKDGLILGIGEGAIGLIKSGLIQGSSFIARNKNAKFTSTIVDIKLTSKLSPWMRDMELGQIYSAPIATKEGRIVLGNDAEKLIENGQIATQFASINPTGSELDVESLTNIDGRILATLSSIDRIGDGIYKNIDIKGNHKIFESGVKYFG
jgi:phosphoribosylformylglycinamidine synthase